MRLNVDSVSYWIVTNNAKDNQLKRSYFDLAKRNLTEARKTQAEGLFADDYDPQEA